MKINYKDILKKNSFYLVFFLLLCVITVLSKSLSISSKKKLTNVYKEYEMMMTVNRNYDSLLEETKDKNIKLNNEINDLKDFWNLSDKEKMDIKQNNEKKEDEIKNKQKEIEDLNKEIESYKSEIELYNEKTKSANNQN